MTDGLSQEDRQQRAGSVKPFRVVDDDPASLLKQAGIIAGFIRFYNPQGKYDGYFDEVLRLAGEPGFQELLKRYGTPDQPETPGKIREDKLRMLPDGNMEPSKALLITFIRQLCNRTHEFNKRWEKYISWYLNDVLKVTSVSACPDSAWVTLTKNIPKNVLLRKGTCFTFGEADTAHKVMFHTTDPIALTNATVDKAYSLYFDKNPGIYPASLFNIPTALKINDLLCERKTEELLFDEHVNPSHSQPVGLCISSPALLLREGKRFITLEFDAEQNGIRNRQHHRNLVKLLRQIQKEAAPVSRKDAKEVLLVKVFNDIFRLEISTPYGWTVIEKYVIKGFSEPAHNHIRKLVLKFELQEDFPETIPCDTERHRYESYYPAIKILLNHDAWLYPYAWLKEFLMVKINIRVDVEGINNVLFYNELGKIDNSMPFAPFGNNTEQGAWFVIGNYEMSMKKLLSADIHIRWQQLPAKDGGLFTYYREYDEKTDNCSFKLKTRYLADYKWKETDNREPFFLFSSVVKDKKGNPCPQHKLSDESVLKDIRVKDMKPVYMTEDDYDYNIRSKSGFFNFVMIEPEMGFGEKAYRRLFSDQLINKSLRKKKNSSINPPITPLVERITLSYKATEDIDLRIFRKEERTVVSHVYPFGIRQIYPAAENKPLPFVFSLDTDANILFGLKEVQGDEFVNLFIDFFPQKKEVQLSQLPRVRWYWGDGYRWSVMPDDAIRKDTTRNLLTTGNIRIYVPEIPFEGFRDKNGIVWLRAGITENEKSISEVNRICTNAVKVFRHTEQMDQELMEGFVLNTTEPGVPGIASVEQITPINAGMPVENDAVKLIRVSEFISHRNRAVTARDYERMTLQAFPQAGKVKCLKNTDTKKQPGETGGFTGTEKSAGAITLVIIPSRKGQGWKSRPYAQPELLLEIENYFSAKTSSRVKYIDAINPLYEEILVRCTVDFNSTEHSNAYLRETVRKVINRLIAPWQQNEELPVFGYSFGIRQLHDKIRALPFVKSIRHLSAVHLSCAEGCSIYKIREYAGTDEIDPSQPHAILIPSANHIIKTGIHEEFGIDEMSINENFVIWQNETEKH